MSKALGKEINEFYNNHFPENCFTDEDEDWIEDYIVNDKLTLPETEKFELSDFGCIVNDDNDTVRLFSSVFKKWLRSRKTAYVLVEVALADKDNAIQKLKNLGFKVKK